ncbi:DUF4876 domain-containing protein [Olivibacter ginsenosidimutans]|uniref:DUF4876 domain-containing protein n=1 Tax=Olivibacter ginsenosidimutans TaxID=1176537 RepID=A0ABP9AVL4_9SPHI
MMKKFILLFVTLASLAACKKDRPESTTVDLQVQLSSALSLADQQSFPFDQVKVTLINLRNQSTSELTPDASGKLTFTGIAAGDYNINAAVTLSRSDYEALTGTDPGADVSFNASQNNLNIPVGFSETISLELVNGTSGAFLIKQVYYAGSDTKNGANFRDQFLEIYNNTDEVLYADGLYVSRLWGKQRPEDKADYYQENGQLDWSKSRGMPSDIDANKDYVYLRDLFQVPGSGNEYPVNPGESIIIAQNALNHKVPFTNNKGDEVSVKDPDLTVDLSDADFEVYYGDIPGKTPFATDIDNPSVPNMLPINYDGNDWILDSNGKDSYIIFKAENGLDVTTLNAYYEPLIAEPGPSAKTYIQLPVDAIMDAVEAQPNLAEDRIPKKLRPDFDAGFAFVTLGRYSSQAIIRKTERTEGGRKILKDTNNSTEDFVVIKANPRGFAD